MNSLSPSTTTGWFTFVLPRSDMYSYFEAFVAIVSFGFVHCRPISGTIAFFSSPTFPKIDRKTGKQQFTLAFSTII